MNPVNASGNPSRQPPISRPVSLAIPPASPAQISPLGHSPMANYCGAQNNAVSVQSTIFYFRFDLMATLIVQYLAIYNSGNVPDSIFCRIGFKNWQKLFCQNGEILPNLITVPVCCIISSCAIGTPMTEHPFSWSCSRIQIVNSTMLKFLSNTWRLLYIRFEYWSVNLCLLA